MYIPLSFFITLLRRSRLPPLTTSPWISASSSCGGTSSSNPSFEKCNSVPLLCFLLAACAGTEASCAEWRSMSMAFDELVPPGLSVFLVVAELLLSPLSSSSFLNGAEPLPAFEVISQIKQVCYKD